MLKTYNLVKLFKKNVDLKRVLAFSTQPVAKETSSEQEDKQLKEFERISNIQSKLRTKLPQKPPFVKNLLLGKFDTDLLSYPELKNEPLNNLNKEIELTKKFLENEDIRQSEAFSKEVAKKLSAGSLLGLQCSQLMGGRELSATELCAFIEEMYKLKFKNSIVSSEVLGIQILNKFASDHLKRKYLQRIMEGELVVAFCMVEQTPGTFSSDVLCTKSMDGKSWVLNGQKKMVMNGSDADIYIVVAVTDYDFKDEIKEPKYTTFVVERDFGGISSTRQSTLDGRSDVSHVVFDKTPIPNDNVIGVEHQADKILTAIFPQYRLSTGPICSNILKELINKTVQHYLAVSKPPNFLYELDAVRIKLGEIVNSLYAVDSMIYFTAGLIDNYENQDTELESAIVKVFSSEQAFEATSKCFSMLGGEAGLANHWCHELHSEALMHVISNDSNDNLKILIALFALRHAGQHLKELVKRLRNPLNYCVEGLKRVWRARRHYRDDPSLDLYLYQDLHPTCIHAAQRLEYCVLRLQYATEIILSRFGAEIVNQHADLLKLGECLMDIYAMTASISRASRSYCIGLQHAEYEINLASSFTLNATRRVKNKLNLIIEGPLATSDQNQRFITERLFYFKEYYPVHPLTRNF